MVGTILAPLGLLHPADSPGPAPSSAAPRAAAPSHQESVPVSGLDAAPAGRACRTRLDCPAVAGARSSLMTGPAGGSTTRSARCPRRQPPRRRCPPVPARSENDLYVTYAPELARWAHNGD